MKTVMAAAAMKRRRPSMTRTPLASRLHKRRGIPIRSLCACLSFAIAADGYPSVRETQAGGCKSARMHLPILKVGRAAAAGTGVRRGGIDALGQDHQL